MIEEKKYNFSFTGVTLRTRDFVVVTRHLFFEKFNDIDIILGNGKKASGRRLFSEISKRAQKLSTYQKTLLIEGSFKAQSEITFIAICKCFDFIRDFIIEVIREKYLVFDYELTEGDYISFFRRKAEYHPEMDLLTEITQKKVKQVTFKILEEIGLIDNTKSKMIQPQILEPETRKAILNDNTELFKIFLLSDFDIENLKT
ncbi:DUF1819 family protein [Nonlabens antarcticus]|uniref:DUF1819 family protein n=1 Tax=Nonlabens antarcticus TaxID=392714 RepID=UPI001891D221|nr:DUF1819 family protein [Nonlabens antarcticus]